MRLNQLQVIGRIGQDAKIVDHNGRKFVAFSLAVDESYKDRNGNKVDKVVWCDCVTEQERFFNVINWLTKGREVYVEGKPSARAYEKDGKLYATIRISVNQISLGNKANGSTTTTAPTTPAPAIAATTAPAPFAIEESDDLPF
ncbi:hypothetical protein GCM10028807_17660 [Spirosoma daeguense]